MRLCKDGVCQDYWTINIGDGKFMWDNCLRVLEWANKNPNKMTSISDISNGTGVPRMSIHWLLIDAKIRGQKSTLYRTSKLHKYKYRIDHTWNTVHKYNRTKQIINAKKK